MYSSENPASPSDESHDSVPTKSFSRLIGRESFTILIIVGAAMLLAFGIIAFVFQSYQVSGESMQQTLYNDDHLIVWKVPRTWARLTGHEYVPDRGDVIIFDEPASGLKRCGSDQSQQLVKRVVGLPGDRVVVANGTIEIFSRGRPNGFFPDKTLGYHSRITQATDGDVDVTLGSRQIFVAGDNRPNSCDSRVFGPVNLDLVVGKLVLRVLPLRNTEVF